MSTQKQLVLPFPPVEGGESRVRDDNNASASERRGRGSAAKVAGRGGDGQAAKAHPIPQNRRDLALAIFARCDPVALGVEVIENNDDRNPTTLLRALETFAEWAYGKEEAEAERAPTRVIWDLPRRGERRDGASSADSERMEGGER